MDLIGQRRKLPPLNPTLGRAQRTYGIYSQQFEQFATRSLASNVSERNSRVPIGRVLRSSIILHSRGRYFAPADILIRARTFTGSSQRNRGIRKVVYLRPEYSSSR